MSVAKTKASGKSHSENILAAGERLQHLSGQLQEFVKGAAHDGDSLDVVERSVLDSVLEIGREALTLFIRLQGDGDLGPEVKTEEDRRLKRSEQPSLSTIRTIFGIHPFEEFTYSAGKKKATELKPISARMSLPSHRWSFLLQEFSQMLSVDQSYSQAMGNLSSIFGSDFSVDTAEQVNAKLGGVAADYLDNLPVPAPETEGQLLVASLDCKGVPLVKEDVSRVAAFESPKKRPGNRRMATVTAVYSVDRFHRTAEDVIAALFRDPKEERPWREPRPRPQNKHTAAHFPELEDDGEGGLLSITGVHVGTAWTMEEVDKRRRRGQTLVVLIDGQESLWDTVGQYVNFGTSTVPILDILHVASYVWWSAKLFEADDKSRKLFARRRMQRILQGEVHAVIRGLRQLATRRNLKGEQLKSLNQICGYFAKNAERMRYHEYLALGYPIATGVIEGACGHLVKDRMERSGMRWTLEGARAMLDVRAAFQSDHWRECVDWHITKDNAKTHPHKQLISGYTPAIAM